MGGPGNESHALVNMALICHRLLENDAMAEAAKLEAREMLEQWRHLASESPFAEGSEDDCDSDEGHALLRRMESFVREQAKPHLVVRSG
jgi:hypothetical protein